MTPKEADAYQQWSEMDGLTAFDLINRHADGCDDIYSMMSAWLRANQVPESAVIADLRKALAGAAELLKLG